ncbi:hypothetical protein MHU86_24119 [Fragilaria crotonensis]|nr:hypothetical protein MHU86_24119 [Fragilaria crotonensis]
MTAKQNIQNQEIYRLRRPTLRDLAHQAASDAKLNSFAHAYEPDPSKALRVATTLSKDFPADTRLANLCDSGLVNQMAFLMDVPNGPATLAILSCPFPTAKGTEAVFAGSLGDAMDVICPVTIRMRDVKGQCITIAPMTSLPTLLSMAISASDPLNEEGPDPEEGTVADPPGPDRLGIEISDPTDTPCITLIPKIFPLTGGYSIPTANIIDVTTTDTIRNLPGSPNLDEFHLWYESMSRSQLLDSNDPLYRKVTSAVLATKENAYVTYGSKLTRRIAFTTPPKAPERINASATHITPTDNVEAILLNLTSAITDNSSKAMTSTEREHERSKGKSSFLEILFASIIETTNDDGTTTKTFKKPPSTASSFKF